MKSMGRERGWPGYSCTEGLEAGEPERWSESWEERERRRSGHWPGVQAARGVSTMGLRRQVDPHRMKVPLDWSLPFSRLGLLSFENTEQTTLTCELHGLQPHWDPQISEQGCSRPWSVLSHFPQTPFHTTPLASVIPSPHLFHSGQLACVLLQ